MFYQRQFCTSRGRRIQESFRGNSLTKFWNLEDYMRMCINCYKLLQACHWKTFIDPKISNILSKWCVIVASYQEVSREGQNFMIPHVVPYCIWVVIKPNLYVNCLALKDSCLCEGWWPVFFPSSQLIMNTSNSLRYGIAHVLCYYTYL